MCCRQKSSASADSVAETSRQMNPCPPDESDKSQSLTTVMATAGSIAVIFSACVDALANANSAMFFGIFVGASSQINPRRVQRAHGSPDEKVQRTLETLQALQTRAGGGMHNGAGCKCRTQRIARNRANREGRARRASQVKTSLAVCRMVDQKRQKGKQEHEHVRDCNLGPSNLNRGQDTRAIVILVALVDWRFIKLHKRQLGERDIPCFGGFVGIPRPEVLGDPEVSSFYRYAVLDRRSSVQSDCRSPLCQTTRSRCCAALAAR